jgi:hypothetical protein
LRSPIRRESVGVARTQKLTLVPAVFWSRDAAEGRDPDKEVKMKHTVLLAVVAAALSLAAPAALSAQPDDHRILGEGLVNGERWHFNAHSGPDGENARGRFAVKGVLEGDITCITVAGDLASFGVVVTDSDEPSLPPGSGLIIVVDDNGPGTTGDLIDVVAISPVPPAGCPPPVQPNTLFQGPLNVH